MVSEQNQTVVSLPPEPWKQSPEFVQVYSGLTGKGVRWGARMKVGKLVDTLYKGVVGAVSFQKVRIRPGKTLPRATDGQELNEWKYAGNLQKVLTPWTSCRYRHFPETEDL